MAQSGVPFLVVEKGDTLWRLVSQAFGITANTAIANKLKTIAKLNSHIKNLDALRPGQVIYLGSPTGIETFPPKTGDLLEMESYFVGATSSYRKFMLDNWETFSAFNDTGRDSFVNCLPTSPIQLKNDLGNPPSVEVRGSSFAVVTPYVWKVGKTAVKTGKMALEGEFGSFLKSPFAWNQWEGKLVRGFNNARYSKMADGVLRMVPKNSRAFQMGGKVITVNPWSAEFKSFSEAVARGEKIASHLDKVGKVAKVIDLGLSVKTVHDKWGTADQNRTVVVETTKFGTGLAWGGAATGTAGVVCGALTLTTGPGGVACYGSVFLVGGVAASAVGEKAGNLLYDAGTWIGDKYDEMAKSAGQLLWIYMGPHRYMLNF